MVGKIVKHYTLLEKIGQGGMGIVYKAEDSRLKRFVALKFLPQQLTINESDRARFLQEAQAASAINHPNVCIIHDIQERLSRSIVHALRLKLGENQDKSIGTKSFKDVHSYECYLKARHEIWQFSEASLERAVQFLQQAIDIIGEHDLLCASLGIAYFQYINAGITLDQVYLQKSEEMAQRALSINPNSADSYVVLGFISETRGDLRKGYIFLKKAVQLNENNPDALVGLVFFYAIFGQSELAKPLVESLLKIDPLSRIGQLGPFWLYLSEGKLERVLEITNKTYLMDTCNEESIFNYGWALAMNEQYKEAQVIFEPATSLKASAEKFDLKALCSA